MSSAVERQTLQDLREKYAEMLRLRDLDAAGDLEDPRPAMRALAARFPGALREIDELSRETLVTRLAALDRALRDPSERADWMLVIARYHARLRLALRVRREIGAVRTLAAARASDDPEVATLDDSSLVTLLRPPGGRLHRAVLAIVAAELGTSAHEIEQLLVERRARR